MQMLNPYLFFNGACREAFEFYSKTFDGRIVAMVDHSAMPGNGDVPAGMRGRIIHARLIVGDHVLMGADTPSDVKPQGFCVNIGVAEAAEAERLYNALAEGGTIMMPMAETFWAYRFGMLTDRYGTPWMINCEKPM